MSEARARARAELSRGTSGSEIHTLARRVILVRMARECELADLEMRDPGGGRIQLTAWHWPPWVGRRRFSDRVLMKARRH